MASISDDEADMTMGDAARTAATNEDDTARIAMRFTLKNLAAEETYLSVSNHLQTLGDLRRFVTRTFNVPMELQRYVCSGRTTDRHEPDSLALTHMLRGTEEGPNQERIIWLLWMRDDDYYPIYQGRIILRTELDQKRELAMSRNQRFEYITLAAWVILFRRAVLHAATT